MIIIRYIVTLAVLAGCSVENDERSPNDPAASGSTTNTTTQAVGLSGTWLITAFDDAPAVQVEDRKPSLTFTRGGYGGTAGCNALGGIGTLQGDRYFSFPGPQTQMGCSDAVGEHEAILHAVMLGSPRTSQSEDGRLVLQANGHRLVLRRDEHTPDAPNQTAPLLDLMRFQIDTINEAAGTRVASKGLSLEFDGPQWRLKTVCGTLSGIWEQRDWLLEISQTEDTVGPCDAEDQEVAKTVGAVLASGPSFALGANGEFLMAGGGNWMAGYGKSFER